MKPNKREKDEQVGVQERTQYKFHQCRGTEKRLQNNNISIYAIHESLDDHESIIMFCSRINHRH